MKWFEKKVDERQEKELYKVEHIGFWAMYWMLFASIVIQSLMAKEGAWKIIAGEWIVFMATCIIVLIGCIRRGVWSFQARKIPGIKEHILWSLAAAVGLGMPVSILNVFKYGKEDITVILVSAGSSTVLVFASCLILFAIVAGLARKREKILADRATEEIEEEE